MLGTQQKGEAQTRLALFSTIDTRLPTKTGGVSFQFHLNISSLKNTWTNLPRNSYSAA
jgi:hypothetical protein